MEIDTGHLDLSGQQLGFDLDLSGVLIARRVWRRSRQRGGVADIAEPHQYVHAAYEKLAAAIVALRRVGDADQEVACEPVLRRGLDAIGQALHKLAHDVDGCVLPNPSIEIRVSPRQGADPFAVPIVEPRRPLAAGRESEDDESRGDGAEWHGCERDHFSEP